MRMGAEDLVEPRALTIAILVTDGFEQVEMTESRKELDDAGADALPVSPKDNQVAVGT